MARRRDSAAAGEQAEGVVEARRDLRYPFPINRLYPQPELDSMSDDTQPNSHPSISPDFDALWDFADPAATERRFRDLLPAVLAGGDVWVDAHARLLTQIARTEGLQRRFEAAHGTLDEAERLLPQCDDVTRVRYLLERGRVLDSSGRPGEARPLFLDAWERARACGADDFAVDAAHMVAIVAPTDGPDGGPGEDIAWNERALALAESSPDPGARRWRGSLYNNLGWSHHDRGDFATALDMFEKALAFREAAGKSGGIRIARWCVARALRSLGRIDEALAIQTSLLAEIAAAGEQDGYVHEELGECMLAVGRARRNRTSPQLTRCCRRTRGWPSANRSGSRG